MPTDRQPPGLTAIAALKDPLDRACFDLVVADGGTIGRDEVSDRLGLARASAAFRLDRLVDAGLLTVEFRRRTGRTGPGAGRPAKLYRAAAVEVSASVPERHYDLAADILATVVDRGGDPRVELSTSAFERGTEIGRAAGSLDAALEQGGYEPVPDGPWQRLTNCPFHRLARAHTATVCALNLALLQGVLEGCGHDPDQAEFAPAPGSCCVRMRRADA